MDANGSKKTKRNFLPHLEDKEFKIKTLDEAKLDGLRSELDNIDFWIFELFEQRMRLVEDIGFLKKKIWKNVVDEQRKEEALEKRLWFGQTLWISPEESEALYKTLHDLAVKKRRDIKDLWKKRG